MKRTATIFLSNYSEQLAELPTSSLILRFTIVQYVVVVLFPEVNYTNLNTKKLIYFSKNVWVLSLAYYLKTDISILVRHYIISTKTKQ